jgi:hypothetical protein
MARLILVPGLLVAVLVLSGALHGIWTDRWEPAGEALLTQAGLQLEDVPLRIGDWRGKNNVLEERAPSSIETIVSRQYSNRQNGNVVGVLLGCTSPRDMNRFHTPEQCYPSRGYLPPYPTIKHTINFDSGYPPAEVFVSDYKNVKGPLTEYLRIFWAFSSKCDVWRAPDNPRLTFGRQRVLYKFYVTRQLDSLEEPVETDPCIDFLREFLPTFDRSVTASR